MSRGIRWYETRLATYALDQNVELIGRKGNHAPATGTLKIDCVRRWRGCWLRLRLRIRIATATSVYGGDGLRIRCRLIHQLTENGLCGCRTRRCRHLETLTAIRTRRLAPSLVVGAVEN